MMKSNLMGLLFLSFLVGFQAQAIYDPTWERPIAQADVVPLDAQGEELSTVIGYRITLNQRDGQPLKFPLL